MGGISAVGVGPGFELRPRTGTNDTRRPVLQLLRDSLDDGAEEWGEQSQNEGCQSLADMVKQLLESWDLCDTTANSLGSFISGCLIKAKVFGQGLSRSYLDNLVSAKDISQEIYKDRGACAYLN